MEEIINYVAEELGFLWIGARFQIVDSLVSESGAYLTLASSDLVIRLVHHRGELTFEFRPAGVPGLKDWEWFPTGVLYELYERPLRRRASVTHEDAAFLADVLPDLERRFSAEQWPATKGVLDAVLRARSRRRR